MDLQLPDIAKKTPTGLFSGKRSKKHNESNLSAVGANRTDHMSTTERLKMSDESPHLLAWKYKRSSEIRQSEQSRSAAKAITHDILTRPKPHHLDRGFP